MAQTTESVSCLAVFGLDPFDETVYRAALRHTNASVRVLADAVGSSVAVLRRSARHLQERGLVRVTTDSVVAEEPEAALGRLAEDEAQRLRLAEQGLAAARAAIPELRAELRRGAERESPTGLEVVPASETTRTIATLVTQTRGEMVFVRLDQWATHGATQVDPVVIAELRRGRPSRALYPQHALDAAPEPIRARARAGERVRTLPELPSRLIVFGDEAALITDSWRHLHGDRLLIRTPGVVHALRFLFDEMWQRATTPPGLQGETGPDSRQLLRLLAAGAIDEQMARALGISLRTVRRRIAALMGELAVTSRFQLGAEVVRRGWL